MKSKQTKRRRRRKISTCRNTSTLLLFSVRDRSPQTDNDVTMSRLNNAVTLGMILGTVLVSNYPGQPGDVVSHNYSSCIVPASRNQQERNTQAANSSSKVRNLNNDGDYYRSRNDQIKRRISNHPANNHDCNSQKCN